MFRKFASYYVPHLRLFAADMFCAFLSSACNMLYPLVTRGVINVYIPERRAGVIAGWMAVLLGVYVFKAGLNYFIQFYGHVMGVRITMDMRRDAFDHLQRLPFAFFDKTKTGTLMSRIINDTFEIAELSHHGPEDLFLSMVMLTGSFVILCTMNLGLTLTIFAFVPGLVWFAASMRHKLSRTSRQTRAEIGEVNAELANSIEGVRVSKAFETSEHELDKFQSGNRAYAHARGQQYRAMAEFFSGTTFIMDLLLLVTLSAGGYFAYQSRIDAGEFAAYLLFVGLFTEPIKRLINFVEQLQNGMAGFARLQELMAEEPEKDEPGAVDLTGFRGDVSFEHVTFRYDGGPENDHPGKNVLSDLCLDIKSGETVALVGPSGGGKSTLCHLLPRFYELDEGRITLDGVDIRRYTRLSLRRKVGIVQQETFLFSGSIRDNIAYGNVDASDAEIQAAAVSASLDEFIRTLSEGYGTCVGERGVMLSGGQKQRIAIARVFLKNPPILILDEATSALDNATEAQIQRSLNRLSQGRTTLVVAHRLSTVRHAGRIVVLTDTGIAEQGRHEELLAKGGLYAALWNAQAEER
ncbi:MAG: ABC transporter ATP-binding protein/permease [Synergistaceae bacterium]|nr:ABC transporter ATP-binding protein/permease [Synergistaceae bacterium]